MWGEHCEPTPVIEEYCFGAYFYLSNKILNDITFLSKVS